MPRWFSRLWRLMLSTMQTAIGAPGSEQWQQLVDWVVYTIEARGDPEHAGIYRLGGHSSEYIGKFSMVRKYQKPGSGAAA